MKMIQVQDFGIVPGDDRWNSLRLEKILEECRGGEAAELVFEEGEYHFYPDYAREILMFIPNHDEDTIKRVAFDLSGLKDIAVTGTNTSFIFHTEILPFYMEGAENIRISGITVDYLRPAYSEGTILAVEPDKMRFQIDKEKYPYQVRNGRIYFTGENFSYELYCGCLEMDGERQAPVSMGHDIGFNNNSWDYKAVWSETADGFVEAVLTDRNQAFSETSKAGNKMIFRHHPRNYPCIYMKECRNISLSRITIYHCSAMGVIAQFSENITLDDVNVARHPEKARVFTASADATHFVYCKGQIHIKNCLFENQLDDPVNVHGIYQRISTVISRKECIIQLMEHQQKGVKIGDVNDRLSVINNETMLREGTVTIQELKRINKDYCYLRTAEELPVTARESFVVENLEYVPDVLIEGCTFRNNRARGLLLTSAGKVVVRGNVFQTAGAAILIEGDSNYWFESGGTNHILVEDNIFQDCAYVPDWGKAPIQISPSAQRYVDGKRYHKLIEIRGNRFICFDDRLLSAQNVEKIIWKDNQVTHSAAFPPIEGKKFVLDGILYFTDN